MTKKNLQQVVMSNSLQGQGVVIDGQFPGNNLNQILFFPCSNLKLPPIAPLPILTYMVQMNLTETLPN
jgi:hypothetical protein